MGCDRTPSSPPQKKRGKLKTSTNRKQNIDRVFDKVELLFGNIQKRKGH
jgi:hypothetical protein